MRPIIELFRFADRHRRLTFLAIFGIAFVLRIAILTQVPRESIIGTGEAGRIARSIVANHSFADPYGVPTGPTAHTTPFYPSLVAALIWVFGDGYTGGLARCILLIATYSLLYALFPALASRFGMPREAGVTAGILAALLPVKRSAEVFRGWEDPFAALTLVGLLLLVLAASRRRVPWWLVGAAGGLAMYISTALAPVLAVAAAIAFFTDRSRPAVRYWAAAALTAVLVMSPWLIRDRLALGHWVFFRDNFGLELRYSNHDGAAPSSELLNARPTSFLLHPSNNPAEAELVARLGEVEYNRREMALALDWIGGHPKEFAGLSLQRFFYFWLGPPQHAFEFAITAAYTLLGLIGLGLVRNTSGESVFRMWIAVLLCYPLVYYFVQYLNRYRVPIDWILWLSAGLLLSRALTRHGKNRALTAAATWSEPRRQPLRR